MKIILDTDKKTITVPWNYTNKLDEINRMVKEFGGPDAKPKTRQAIAVVPSIVTLAIAIFFFLFFVPTDRDHVHDVRPAVRAVAVLNDAFAVQAVILEHKVGFPNHAAVFAVETFIHRQCPRFPPAGVRRASSIDHPRSSRSRSVPGLSPANAAHCDSVPVRP